MKKACNKHGKVEHFKREYGYGWRCRKCAREAVANRRRKLKLMAIERKGGKCQRCGYCKSVVALHFHHRDPKKKSFGLGVRGLTRSWKRIAEEVDKCDLLCANCHAETHEEHYGAR